MVQLQLLQVSLQNFTANTTAEGLWGQLAQDTVFGAIGNKTYALVGGKDYGGTDNKGMAATLGDLTAGYELFSNKDEIEINFLLMGPGCTTEVESQAKANKLISIANGRKDCVACISPHRNNVVDVSSTTDQTNNIIKFFSPLASSSFAFFDQRIQVPCMTGSITSSAIFLPTETLLV